MSASRLGEYAVRLALRCYPRWWRDRYGSDQEALVEDLKAEQIRRSWRAGAWGLAGSFAVGAVWACISGKGMPAAPDLWQRRARTAIITACLPAALAAGTVLLLVGHTSEYGTSGTGSTSGADIQLSGAAKVAYGENLLLGLLSLAFVVQLVWVAVGLAGEMRSLAPPRRRMLVTALTLVPAVAGGLGLLLLIAAARLRPVVSGGESIGGRVVHVWYSYPGHPLAATLLFGAGITGILGGWLGGTMLLATMAARRSFPLQALTVGVRRARAIALVQAAVALSALALVITLPLQQPIGPAGGLIYRIDLGPWTSVLCAALVAGALTTWAATRAAGQAVTRAASIT